MKWRETSNRTCSRPSSTQINLIFLFRMGKMVWFDLMRPMAALCGVWCWLANSTKQRQLQPKSFSFFSFHWFINEIEKELKRLKAERDWWNQLSGIVGWVVLFFCGLWAGPPANAPQKRENNNSNQPKRGSEFLLFLLERLLMNELKASETTKRKEIKKWTERRGADEMKWRQRPAEWPAEWTKNEMIMEWFVNAARVAFLF